MSAFLTVQETMPLYIFLMMAVFSFTIFARVELVQNGAHTMELMETAMDKLERIEKAKFIDEDAAPVKLHSYDIEFDGVAFGYDKRKVLDGVSFHIPQAARRRLWARPVPARRLSAICWRGSMMWTPAVSGSAEGIYGR